MPRATNGAQRPMSTPETPAAAPAEEPPSSSGTGRQSVPVGWVVLLIAGAVSGFLARGNSKTLN